MTLKINKIPHQYSVMKQTGCVLYIRCSFVVSDPSGMVRRREKRIVKFTVQDFIGETREISFFSGNEYDSSAYTKEAIVAYSVAENTIVLECKPPISLLSPVDNPRT